MVVAYSNESPLGTTILENLNIEYPFSDTERKPERALRSRWRYNASYGPPWEMIATDPAPYTLPRLA